MRIYVASSWKNQIQAGVVIRLRAFGHAVYDFTDPDLPNTSFTWAEIDPNWKEWSRHKYRQEIEGHPLAEAGFNSDMNAMHWADACVLVLPCGRSAHLEAGWFIGQDKPTAILLDAEFIPELMYKMAAKVCIDMLELDEWVKSVSAQLVENRHLDKQDGSDNPG